MSVLRWCKEITLLLSIGVSCNASTYCETVSTCEMVCDTIGPSYNCRRRGLMEVPSFPESTVELDLSDNAIRTLYSDTFSDYFNVQKIDLSNNSLTGVPDAVFMNNVKLDSLIISNNNLTSVPAAVFWNNLELGYLDLSNNKLTSVPDAVFRNNVILVSLELVNNNLTIVPDDVFKNNLALSYLDIRGNTLTNLPLNLFSSNVDMEQLDLSNNNLISVLDAVFWNNVALQYLDISNNNLTSIPVAVFRNNVALEKLSVSNNILTSVPDAVFENNVKLETLDLSNNKLTSVPDAVFRNNLKLESLDLSNNKLTSLPDAVFRINLQLVSLNLANNYITSIHNDVFKSNVALLYFDLSNNSLTSVADAVFRNNVALTNLYCKECFDCDCLSASTYQWITKIVKDLKGYEFTCRNGVALPNTVVSCSDNGSRLTVMRIENESSCNCKDANAMQSSSMDFTIETTPAMESTIDKVQHKTKTNDSSYTYIASIISGMVASITLISAFTGLRRFINTTSRIKHSDLTDTENNNTINDGIDFITTIDGEMAKKYNNIPPKSHMILSSFSNISCIHHIMVLEKNATIGEK